MDRLNPVDVWFQLQQPFPWDQLANHAVRTSALKNPLKRREFGFRSGDDHFPANLVGDFVFGAEFLHASLALPAVFRF